MTHSRSSNAHELFLELADLPASEQQRLLDQRSDGDPSLRQEVETLLRSEGAMPATFLGGLDSEPSDLRPGTQLGGYEIVRFLGEGGMGTVYEARQSSPTRSIALKVIHSSRMSHESLRRFRYEAEVLGALQHPGIAQIYEAGTALCALPSGQTTEIPYLAMELVRGVQLRHHADTAQLSIHERIELVARTCDAVHHAHQRGVIHRDLKSENVLVEAARQGSEQELGQPKVLDFGIARVIEAEHHTRLTRMGEVVGTLGAMSPEQVSGESGLDVRTDVYSLGVLLYELLSGHAPVDISGCALPVAMRRISSEEPAPLDSHAPELRGDITVIAGKALHKDKSRRYQSASALAEDLRRYLRGAPIRARADSAWYVIRRVLLQHRLSALGALLFLTLGIAFVVVTRMQSERNRSLANAENAARVRAEAQLTVSNIERGRMFAENHNGLGEELIWREYLRDPSSRHAYWALWEFYSHNPCLATRLGHDDRARQAEVSPTGEWFATGDNAGVVAVWDASGRKLHEVPNAGAAVRAMSPAPDGQSLAISYIDGTVMSWDIGSRAIRWSVKLEGVGPGGTVQASGARSLSHHPTLDLLVTSGAMEHVEVLSASTGERVRKLAHEQSAWSVAFSPDGTRLAATGSPTVRIWGVPSFELLTTLPGHTRNSLSGVFSSDRQEFITGGNDRLLIAWDIDSGRPLRTLQPGNGWVRRLTRHSSGDALFANGLYRAEVLSLPDFEILGSVPFFDSATAGFAAFPDDSLVVTTADSGTVRLWETADPPGRRAFPGHAGPVRATISSDGTYLATGDESGTIRLWRVSSGELLRTIETQHGRVRSIRFRPGRLQVFTTDPGGALHMVDLETNDRSSIEGGLDMSNRAFDVSPDGELIAAACSDLAFRVWRVDDQVPVREISVAPFQALSITFSPDGQRLATVSRRKPTQPAQAWAHKIDVWDVDGTHIASEESGAPWWSISFSQDGSALVSGTWDWRVGLWRWEDGSLDMLEGHEGTVWDARFLPQPIGLIASCSADGSMRLWDAETLRNVLTLNIFERADAVSVDASADGTLLAVAGESNEALVCDLTHFDRHIAGNLEAVLPRLRTDLGDESLGSEIEDWAAEVMARPWPRLRR